MKNEDILAHLFRVMELMKCIEPELEAFKGATKSHSLNYAMGHGLQAVRKTLQAGFLAMKTPEAMEIWERQLDPER